MICKITYKKIGKKRVLTSYIRGYSETGFSLSFKIYKLIYSFIQGGKYGYNSIRRFREEDTLFHFFVLISSLIYKCEIC